jgi:hypothetical protein
MHAPFVQNKGDFLAQRPSNRDKESADLQAGNVVCVDTEVKVELSSLHTPVPLEKQVLIIIFIHAIALSETV